MIETNATNAVFATLRLTLQTLHRKGVLSDQDARDIIAELEAEAATVEVNEPGHLSAVTNSLRHTLGILD